MSDRTEELAEGHHERLLDKANVVGVAGGEDDVIVLVTAKQPLWRLAAEDVVDPEIDGVPTDVIEVGEIQPMLAEGDSIGLRDSGTGTLGAVVVDEHGNRYALTNNHVAAASNLALVLEDIHHPGQADGLGDPIGKLARFEPIYFDRINRVDAALVRLDDGLEVERHARPETTTGRVGWTVQKYGRTTGRTEGRIIARNATIDVNFGAQGVARFTGQILTDNMLSPGDSGSVLLSTSRYPVALGFAGSDAVSVHTPINLVLRTLSVSFA